MSGSDLPATAGLWAKAARLRVLAPIMLGVCVIGTGNGLLTTSVSVRLSETDLAPHMVQLLLTGFSIGFLVGCLAAQWIIVRLGHRATFLLFGLLATVATAGFVATSAPQVWFGLRVLNGLSMATLFVVAESWINLYASKRHRGAYFSLYMMMTSLAVLFGQLLIEAAGAQSPYLFLLATLTIAAGLLYCLLAGPWPQLPAEASIAEEPEPASAGRRFGLWHLAMLVPVTIV
eukprot:gene32599-37618_t